MGLFGSILQAGGGIVGSIIGGNQNKKAIDKASQAQIDAYNRAIDEQRRQFDLTRSDYMPWMDAGKLALGGLGDLVGINGNDKAAAAIAALKGSPVYQSMYDNGQEAVLQNASATGGLRGGNTIGALADFGRDTLAQVYQQQIGNLGGISGTGANMTQGIGALGQANAQSIAQGLIGIGQAQAGAILGKQNVRNNTMSQIQQIIMGAATGGMGGGFGGFGF